MLALGGLHRAARHAAVQPLTTTSTDPEGPASAGPSRVRLLAAALALTVAAAGCAVGDGGTQAARPLPEELAVRPQSLVVGVDPTTTTTGSPTGKGSAPGAASATSPTTTTATTPATARSGDGATTTTSMRPYRQVADVADRTGDAGLQTRPYGDLIRLRLEDDGARARFTVETAGDLPASMPAREQLGIGVDLFRGDTESEYQVYAHGNDEGWLAYLDTPSGFVDYPGTFELGGNRLVFTVPWSSLGGRRSGSISAFADWSKGRAAVVADASQDRAPDSGAQSFSF